ncbi:MAG: hypothetical protein IJD60_08315 [Clostridia bacterium]|nr:hypothetical protein [Clostridia bacterium]
MQMRLLHVLKAQISSSGDADDALRAMRHALPRRDNAQTVLLLCDLFPSPTADAPGDDALVRRLQSGVMAAQAIRAGAFELLVRRRAFDDAQRLFLGAGQAPSAEQVIADLLCGGRTQASFLAATLSPASVKGRYDAVLFSDVSLVCTPDTPRRMLRHLSSGGKNAIAAKVLAHASYPQSTLSRLVRSGFSFSAAQCAREARRLRSGLSAQDAPRLYLAEHIPPSPDTDSACPVAPDCVFVRRFSPSLAELYQAHRRSIFFGNERFALLPLARLLLLLLFARLGLTLPALLALILPERSAALHPRLLPGALVRLALLPITAFSSLDAWLQKRLAHAARFRLRVPAALITPAACAFWGVLLILAAFSGAGALHVLLPAALLWLAAPLLVPALSMPTLERIPVTPQEQAELRSLAEAAFFSCFSSEQPGTPLTLRMLTACAGAMLGLLEPDEAARHVQTLFEQLQAPGTAGDAAVSQAAMIASAQYLRETMERCDAALRPLPARIDSYVLSHSPAQSRDALGTLLRAALSEQAPYTCAPAADASALSALFLPLRPIRDTPMHALTLPLTHPHTYLRRQNAGLLPPPDDPCGSFLSLCAAALGHPFHALLLRSHVTAPYMPLLGPA